MTSLDSRSTIAEQRTAEILRAAARSMAGEGSQAVSMQAVAAEAGVSVGLLYRYFGGKDDLLMAVILDVLETLRRRVPEAVRAAGDDPVRRLVAAFAAYCTVIDEHRHAAVLTYRETKSLGPAERERLKGLEMATTVPVHEEVSAGIAAGAFRAVDADLVVYNLLLAAHGWALKHWFLEGRNDLDGYVRAQTSLWLHALLEPRRRRRYTDLLDLG